MKQLRGRIAVVTGAAGGIGRCIALALAHEGMDLVLADVNDPGSRRVAQEVEALGRRALCVTTDVRTRAAFERLLSETLTAFGSCHLLVNNAGVFHAGSVLDSRDEQWERVIAINLWGVIHGSRVFARHFVSQGEGHVVNVASGAGLMGTPGMTAYSASKFGVVGFSETLRWEVAERGVGVTVACPGVVRTDIGRAQGVGLEHIDLDSLLRFAPEPEPLARKIVRAIRRDSPRVFYGFEAHLFVLLRLVPYRIADTLGRFVARRALRTVGPQTDAARPERTRTPRTSRDN